MAYSIEWQIPGRVIVCRIVGDTSLDEAQVMGDTMAEWIAKGTGPVHTIFEVSQMGKFPTSISQINQMSRWIYHPSTGWLISINTSRAMSFVAIALTTMARINHRAATSLDEAMQILQRVDSTLPASQV